MKEKFDGMKAFVLEKADQATHVAKEFVDRDETKAAIFWTKSTANTMADEAVELGKNTANTVHALIEHEDTKAVVAWTRDTIGTAADEAVELGKRAAQSEMAKDAVTGAAIGAAIAVPVPVIGPAFGAIIGAGVGVYKNITSGDSGKATATENTSTSKAPKIDIHKQLIELDDLRQKGILSQEEFNVEKNKILRR